MFSHSFVEGGGVHIRKPVGTGGSTCPLADLDLEGTYPLAHLALGGSKSGGVQICKDTGFPGEKSGLKYPQLLQSLLSMNQVKILRALVCKNQTNPKFRGKDEKFDFFLICIRRVVTQCKSYNGKLFFRG